MPAGGAVARRYAQAAFDIATEQNALDQWKRDLDLAAAVFANPQVARDFDDPKVSEANKRNVVTQNLQGKVSPQALNMIYLLVQRGRTNLIVKVAEEFTAFYNRARNIAVADVTTAMPLGDEEMRKVVATLGRITGKQIQVRAHVNPAIIGGLVARVGDELIDASIATRLHELAMRIA